MHPLWRTPLEGWHPPSSHWSPDGRFIAALKDDSIALMIFDFTTQEWTEAFPSQVAYETFSHDGKYIYFLNLPAPDFKPRVLRLRMNDRKIEEVVDPQKAGPLLNEGPQPGLASLPTILPLSHAISAPRKSTHSKWTGRSMIGLPGRADGKSLTEEVQIDVLSSCRITSVLYRSCSARIAGRSAYSVRSTCRS